LQTNYYGTKHVIETLLIPLLASDGRIVDVSLWEAKGLVTRAFPLHQLMMVSNHVLVGKSPILTETLSESSFSGSS
jgi:hypothetical protein